MDPEVPSLLKGLMMMCGVFTTCSGVGHLEWNACVDPHATAIVYQADVKIHRSIGLDITTKVVMNEKEVKEKFKAKLLQPVLDLVEIWFQRRDKIVFHDPLAAATIFDEQNLQVREGESRGGTS